MTLPPEIPFIKMEGCGNDYVYVDLPSLSADLARAVSEGAPQLAPAMSDRHFGIGSDGLILITTAVNAHATMVMYNVDGTRGAMCGNALRCIAKYLGDTRFQAEDTITIDTDAGLRTARVSREGGRVTEVEVDMAAPRFDSAAIPITPEAATVLAAGGEEPWRLEVVIHGQRKQGFALSMGNPHLVVFVDEVEALDLPSLGPSLENAPWFPDRANVEFVEVRGRALCQRTWERGSGETLACGSGACAVAVAAVAEGHAARGEPIEVRLRGGRLQITWTGEGPVSMRGPARISFTGIWRP